MATVNLADRYNGKGAQSMPNNPFIFGGQIAQTSTNEPERITSAGGQRVMLMSNDAYGRPVQAGSAADQASRTAAAPGLSMLPARAPRNLLTPPERERSTVNPNAFKTGGRSAYNPQRMAETMVRRRDPRGAAFLFNKDLQQGSQEFSREMQGRQEQAAAVRDERNFEQGLSMFGLGQEAEAARDEREWGQTQTKFGMEQQEYDRRFEISRAAELEDADRDSVVGLEFMTDPEGMSMLPVARTKGGSTRPMGSAMPVKKQEPGMTADDIAAARAMGGEVEMPGPGGAKIKFKQPKAPADPRYVPVPGRAPAFAGDTGAEDQVFDPRTGLYYLPGQVPQRGAPAAGKKAYNPFE